MTKDYRWLNSSIENHLNDFTFKKVHRILFFGKFAKSFSRTQINGLYNISKFVTFISFAEMYHSLGHKLFQIKVKSICKNYSVKIILIDLPLGGYQFDDDTFKILKNNGIKIFGLAYDNGSDNKFYIEKYSQFNGVLCTSPLSRFEFDFVGIPSFLIWPQPSKKIKTNDKIIQDIDVSFIGALKANRLEWINKLKKKGVNVEVYGYGTKNGHVNKDKYFEIMQRSKITLNFNRPNTYRIFNIFDKNLNWRTGPTLRNVEAASTGTMCLTEWIPEIELMFPVNTVDYFNDLSELEEKIKYYLNNPEERNKRAKNTYLYANTNLIDDNLLSKGVKYLCSKEAENFLYRGNFHRKNNGYNNIYKFGRLVFFVKRFFDNFKNIKLKECFFNLKMITKDIVNLNFLIIVFLVQIFLLKK
tara:strand:+ start:392 stop:1633 length:1242 start_codon:yes stop_codon:yes gene_type:complete